MRGPLAVRVNDRVLSRNVTARTRGLRFTKSAYGGDVDLACTLQVPRGLFDDLGPGDVVDVFDSRTGLTVWSGNTDNPGTTAGPAGDRYELQAFGAAVRLQAANTPLGYVVTSLESFNRSTNSVKGAQTGGDERADGTPTLMISANEGKSVSTTWAGEFITRTFKRAGLQISRVRADIDAGVDAAAWQMQIRVGETADSLRSVKSKNAGTTADTIVAYSGSDTGFGTPDFAAFRVVRNDSPTTGTDDHWFEFFNPVVRQTLLNRRGGTVGSGYDRNHVYAHEVIADMLGRGMLPRVDPDRIDLPETTYPIDALDWLEGITMGEALAELRVFEPSLWWKAAGSSFEAGHWEDKPPRYVVSKRHGGITFPGEEFTLCNRVAVSWRDRRGKDQVTVVRVPVEGLNYTRDAEPISLPDGLGSEANARRAGEKVLELAANPPRAGRAVVRQRIRDQWQGCDVHPHEIEPGCRVMEQETGDVLRLTEVEYVDADGAAVLTLGEPALSQEQQIARLARRQRRRKRR